LDLIVPEPGAFYLFDRAYTDFQRLYIFEQAGASFVSLLKKSILWKRRYSHKIDKATGVRSDQTIILTGKDTPGYYPQPLRRIHFYSEERSLLHNDFRIQRLNSMAVWNRRLNSLFSKHLFLTFYMESHFCQKLDKIKHQIGKKQPFYQFQQASPLRHSFKRLCVAHIRDHSLRHASMPRRINLSKPRTSLICPNTGSTVLPRILYIDAHAQSEAFVPSTLSAINHPVSDPPAAVARPSLFAV